MGLTTAKVVVCVVFTTTLCCFSLLRPMLSPQHSPADMKMVGGDKTMHGTHNFRKVLYALKDKEKNMIFIGNENGNGNRDENRNMKKKKIAVERELRAAPLGPDPLHHNGGSPRKKPTTMP